MMCAADGGQFGDGLEDAGFVVGPVDAHERGAGFSGVLTEGLGQFTGIDAAEGVHGEVEHLNTEVGQVFGGLADGGVLCLGGDQQAWGRFFVGRAEHSVFESASEGEVVGFRAAGGEDQLAVAAVEKFGECGSGELDALPGGLAHAVHAGGVGPAMLVHLPCGGDDLRGRLGGGVVVEIDGVHGAVF